jgi:CO/xanthine dehydrogenase FAD-binding subunit
MRVLRPASLDDALAAMGPGVTPIAGGTDLLVSWHHRDKEGLTLLDLSRIEALRGWRFDDETLELGALTTYWDVMDAAEIVREAPLLPEAARQVGAIQIQTRGTWAGNIANASPAADGVPVLMAYDAQVTLASTRGRRSVALAEYYTGYKQTLRAPDELLVAIRVPRRARNFEWFHKVGARAAQAITKVGVAMTRLPAGWRVVANSVAPFVCRCRNLEAALDAGATFRSSAEVRDVLARDVTPITDMRSTAAYRLNVLARLIQHRLQQA